MAKPTATGARLIGVFLAGCLLLNYPLLHLFNRDAYVLGIPVLFVYVFCAWIAVIALAALAMRWRD
jgi:hypothetical protein